MTKYSNKYIISNIICSIVISLELVIIFILIHNIKALDTKSSYDKNKIVISSNYNLISSEIDLYEGKKTATLTVVGDIMVHDKQIERAYIPETDSFSFEDSFVYMEDYLNHADLTIGNLETTFAGRNMGSSSEIKGYSGYPMFNAPEILAKNLADVGFDFLGTSNNHSLDSFSDGIVSTLDHIEEQGLLHTGTYRTKEEAEKPCIVEINGIKFGFIAYTYCTNGIPLPQGAPYMVNTLEYYEQPYIDEMYEKVRKLDGMDVDFVCILMHFGTEYSEYQDSWQEMVADGLFEAGADVIFGSHPHVVEPMEVKEITNPDNTTRKGYVLYSHGNFISSQRFDGANKDLGILTDFTFTKEEVNGEIIKEVSEIKVVPTYVYWKDDHIGVVPILEAYNNKEKFSFLSDSDYGRINFGKDYVINLLMHSGQFDYEEVDNKYIIKPKN